MTGNLYFQNGKVLSHCILHSILIVSIYIYNIPTSQALKKKKQQSKSQGAIFMQSVITQPEQTRHYISGVTSSPLDPKNKRTDPKNLEKKKPTKRKKAPKAADGYARIRGNAMLYTYTASSLPRDHHHHHHHHAAHEDLGRRTTGASALSLALFCVCVYI